MNKILVLIFLAAYATLWFAMLRYDIMMYFSEQWQQNGKGMEQGLEAVTKTQLSFDFERQGNGGYINKGVFHDLFGMEGIIQSN